MAVDSEGRRYWRSVEEFLDTPEFQEMLHREFPEQASEWTDPVTRRRFLMLMGASLALMGLNGCSTQPAPREKIMPYVRQPEAIVPGKPLYFATAMPSRRRRHRHPRREPRGPADEDRRQSAVIPPASAPPICSCRRRSSACTIPTVHRP